MRSAHARRILQVGDQGTAALVNFGVNTAVARIGGVIGLGQFNLPYTLYLCAVALQRAVVIEPLLASRDADRFYAGAVRVSVIGTLATGFAIAVVGAILGLPVMVALGALLPLLLLQDLVRYKHLRDTAPHKALAMDGLWLVVTLSPLVVPVHSTVLVVVLWGAGAAGGILLGVLLGARPRFARTDLAHFRHASRGISGATAVDMVIDQLLWILPVAIALQATSVEVSGQYRVAITLMAPLGVLASSWTLSTYARVRESTDVRTTSVLPSSFAILGISLAYAGVMLVVHPWVSTFVFGTSAAVPFLVMLLVCLQIPVQSFEGQLAVWFKVNRAAVNITTARACSTVVIALCLALSVIRHEPLWLTAAISGAGALHAAVSLVLYRRLRTRHDADRTTQALPADRGLE